MMLEDGELPFGGRAGCWKILRCEPNFQQEFLGKIRASSSARNPSFTLRFKHHLEFNSLLLSPFASSCSVESVMNFGCLWKDSLLLIERGWLSKMGDGWRAGWEVSINNRSETGNLKRRRSHLLPWSEMGKSSKWRKLTTFDYTKLLPCIIRNNKLCKVPLKKI